MNSHPLSRLAAICAFAATAPFWLASSALAQPVTWTAPQAAGAPSVGTIGVGDFNGDGLLDYVAGHSGHPHIYLGPNFSEGVRIGDGDGKPYGGAVADFNGDGWPDVIMTDGAGNETATGDLFLYLHPGSAENWNDRDAWTRTTIYSFDVWHQNDLVVTDLDGDGRLDVVVRTRSPENRVVIALQNADLTNWTARGFAIDGQTAQWPEGIAVGDVTGDGKQEIVLSGIFWTNTDWRNGTPSTHMIDPDFFHTEVKAVVADLDGDGLNDIVMAKAERSQTKFLSWYRNTGNPLGGAAAWPRTIIWNNITNVHGLAVADFDGNGMPDIFAGRAFNTPDMRIFYNVNNAASWTEQVVSAATGMYVVAIADLDNDGDLDLIGPAEWNGRVHVLYNHLIEDGGGPADPEPPMAPVFTTQPTDLTVTTGQSASFTVAVSGSPTPTLFWQKLDDFGTNWTNLSGETGITLSFPIATLSEAGTYRAVAANTGGTIESTSAVLSVIPASDPGPELFAEWIFEETEGNTILDTAGTRHGFLDGGTRIDGPLGRALEFKSIGDRVALPTFDLPGLAMTISGWVRVDAQSVADARIISKANGTNNANHVWMLGLNSNMRLRARIRTTGTNPSEFNSPNNALSVGQWHHVALVYDGSYARLFVDASQVASIPLTGPLHQDASIPVAIGNQPAGAGDRQIEGGIDQLRIHTKALTHAELLALIAEEPPVDPTDPEPTFTVWIEDPERAVPTGQRGHLDDPDSDGISNFLEYAFGGNPMRASTATLPKLSTLPDGRRQIVYLMASPMLTYLTEFSTDLSPGSWQTLDTPEFFDSNTGLHYRLLPSSPDRLFFRLTVFTMPEANADDLLTRVNTPPAATMCSD